MPNPALAVQKAIRQRLVASEAVTSLVPANSILDRNERPAPDPSIIIGEDQIIDTGMLVNGSVVRVASTIHVWKVEPSLVGVKSIVGAIWQAFRGGRLALDDGCECIHFIVTDYRFMRDPDGATSHGIVQVLTMVRIVA